MRFGFRPLFQCKTVNFLVIAAPHVCGDIIPRARAQFGTQPVVSGVAAQLNMESAMGIPEEREHKTDLKGQLLAAVQQAIIATDLQGKILFWNPFADAGRA